VFIPLVAQFGWSWNLAQLHRLIFIPFTLFFPLTINVLFQKIAWYSPGATAALLGLVFTFFLLVLHIHFSMIRAHLIPHAFPRSVRREFIGIVGDILHHQQFTLLKGFYHHTGDVYDHVIRVSYISYALAKACKLDYRSAARAGLLHDFFLYDWRERRKTAAKKSLHGKEHPGIALHNARLYFSLNAIEEDSILKHMFPKTLHLPRYKESLIVSLADKIATVYEYLRLLWQ